MKKFEKLVLNDWRFLFDYSQVTNTFVFDMTSAQFNDIKGRTAKLADYL